MILAHSSAWVEYDRATGSAVDRRLAALIAADELVAVTEPVVMEVLAAARSAERESDLRRLLRRFHLLAFDATTDFEGAVRIYRRCRAAGVTPRGMVDCLIAAVAWRTGATLLAQDADMHHLARVVGIALDNASPGPQMKDHLRVNRETVRRWLRARKLRGVLLSQQGGYRIPGQEE